MTKKLSNDILGEGSTVQKYEVIKAVYGETINYEWSMESVGRGNDCLKCR